MAVQEKVFSPQPGPQTDFLATDADVCIYGGAAGGGKSFGLLLDPLRHLENPFFRGVYFRRTSTQVKNLGGLWNEASEIYTHFGGVPKEKELLYTFPSGMLLKFTHLEHEKDKQQHQGGQYTAIYFDELTHFTESQFWYLMSRNRSKAGIPGYIRATCNPDADSWVRNWIDWWIDPETGYPIPERSGVLRWFLRIDGDLHWADTKSELIEMFGKPELAHDHIHQVKPRSFTFIMSSVYDNEELLKVDSNYLSNLESLNVVEKERLLMGNWNIKPTAGIYFNRTWVNLIDHPPINCTWVRSYDFAATEPNPSNPNPDYTAGVKIGITPEGQIIVGHMEKYQFSPGKVLERVKQRAEKDGFGVRIVIPRDPGAAGKESANSKARELSKYDIRVRQISKDKVTYFLPFSAAAENGLVSVVKGSWNEAFFKELENFDGEGRSKDDVVDATSLGYNELAGRVDIITDIEIPSMSQNNRWAS